MQTPYIRPYNNEDLSGVTDINRQIHILPFNESWAINHYLNAIMQSRGSCFVAEDSATRIMAFGIINPVPSRPNDFSLQIGVAPNNQYAGVGKALMETLKDVAAHRGAENIVAILQNEDFEIANFLEDNGFRLRNYTWQLFLSNETLRQITPEPFPVNLKLESLTTSDEEEFQKLLRRALGDKPRFERYAELDLSILLSNEEYQMGEVLIARAENDKQPVGLAVIQLDKASPNNTIAEVEPVGVVPQWRNRNLEEALLRAALLRARDRSATMAEIWIHSADNTMLDVYTELGFERVACRITYSHRLARS